MKKILILWIILVSSLCFASNTIVTATITGTDGQVWANGSYIITFQTNGTSPGPYNVAGVAVPTGPFTGSLDSTGTFSVTLTDNNTIAPGGSHWQFNVCPNATAQCIQASVTVTGATQNLSTTLSNAAPATVVNAFPLPRAYLDSEVKTPQGIGGVYYNTLNNHNKYFDGTNWNNSANVSVGLDAAKPATCIVPQEYLATDTLKLYACTATNTWAVWAGGVGTTALSTAITSACNGTVRGAVFVPSGTYTLAAALSVPSNCSIWWQDATIVSNGYNGDLVQLSSVSNVSFHGKLTINGTAAGTGATSDGLHVTGTTNFSWEDVDISNTLNQCLEIEGSSHIRGAKFYGTSCGSASVGGGGDGLLIWNNGATPSTDVDITNIDVATTGQQNCVYVSGTASAMAQRINLSNMSLSGCADEAFESDFSNGLTIGNISASTFTNVGALFRETTNAALSSIVCNGGKECVDIADYAQGDGNISGIAVGTVVANVVNSDGINGSAVRVSNGSTTATISNVTISNITSIGSTRGFRCATAGGAVSNLIVGNLTASGSTVADYDTSGCAPQAINVNGRSYNSSLFAIGAPATLSGTGACATTSTQHGGSTAGDVLCTGTTGASTLTITTGITAPASWSCWASDGTHALAGIQTTFSATAPVITFSSVTTNDKIGFGCVAY